MAWFWQAGLVFFLYTENERTNAVYFCFLCFSHGPAHI